MIAWVNDRPISKTKKEEKEEAEEWKRKGRSKSRP